MRLNHLADYSRRKRTLLTALLMFALSVFFAAKSRSQSTAPSLSEAADPALIGIRKLVDDGSYPQAEAIARNYLETHAASSGAHYLLAYSLMRQGKPKDSLAEYTIAAQIRTPSAEDLKNVALDYVLLGDYSDADKWMHRSVLADPSDSEAWYGLGRILYTENHFVEAVTCFNKTLALSPRSVKAANNLGLAYEGLNRVDDAVRAYRQAIAWQQDSPHPSEQPLLNLAIVLSDRGDAQQALALLLQAAAISPRDAKIHEHLGRVYMQLNDLVRAQAELEQAVSIAPDQAALHYQLGQIYRRSGLNDRAASEFAKTAEINGTHSSKSPDR